MGTDVLDLVESGRMPWLERWKGHRVFLLEFPAGSIPVGSLNLVNRLVKDRVAPMIAHPERNLEIQRNIHKLEPFIATGCLALITAGSLTGAFGKPAFDTAVEMLERGWVTFMATNCHNMSPRPPNLQAGLDAAIEIVGAKEATKLVTSTAERITKELHH